MQRSEDPTPDENGGQEQNPLRRLVPELKPFRGLVLLCAMLAIAQSAFGFLPPLVLGDIVNRLQTGEAINTTFYLFLIVGFQRL